MKEIRAENNTELFTVLKNIDISVPPRTEGRTTEHCETWTICRLLATLVGNSRLVFPIQLIKRERPDFLLFTGDRCIGIEVTEAINEEYAKATTLPEADNDNFVIDPSLFKWDTPRRKLPELRRVVSCTKLTGPGWDGNTVEREYADAIFDVLTVKTEKLRGEKFERFGENWLAVYCNITLPILRLDEASSLFMEKVYAYWSENGFSEVFVEKGDTIVSYSRYQTEVMRLEDLWKAG